MSNQGFDATMGPSSPNAAASSQWNAGTVTALASSLSNTSGTLAVRAVLRTIPFPLVGAPPGGQAYSVVFTQAGTLLANGGAFQSYVPTHPTGTETLTVNTIHGGSVTAQGSIVINSGGTVTPPSFAAVAIGAGDVLQIVNQGTADATFKDASFSFQGFW